jgi:ABC-type uncharacterized transport system substrate-binding protein
MQKLVPGLRAVGTMYNPAEANSVKEQAVAREVQYSSLVAGKMAGQVLLGENPKDMPIEEVAVEEVSISRSNAEELGITIHAEFARSVRP